MSFFFSFWSVYNMWISLLGLLSQCPTDFFFDGCALIFICFLVSFDFFLISLLTHSLFNNILFSFHVCVFNNILFSFHVCVSISFCFIHFENILGETYVQYCVFFEDGLYYYTVSVFIFGNLPLFWRLLSLKLLCI